MFQQKAYAAAIPPLQAFVRQVDAEGKPLPAEGERMEAEYMLVCAAYELKDTKSIDKLRAYLDEYPDTPYANRIYALMASVYFFEGNYDAAMAMFNASRLDLLGNEERDDMTYRLAKLSRETGLRAGFMHVPTQTAYACRHRERMLAAAADEEAKEKLLAAPIAGMELEMMVRGTRAALEACLPSLPL